mgnify:CR=1 FL=1
MSGPGILQAECERELSSTVLHEDMTREVYRNLLKQMEADGGSIRHLVESLFDAEKVMTEPVFRKSLRTYAQAPPKKFAFELRRWMENLKNIYLPSKVVSKYLRIKD